MDSASATRSRQKMGVIRSIMEGRDYGCLKDFIADRSRWR